jgi:hypothetical protein
MIAVELNDAFGAPLSLSPGKTASLSFPIAQDLFSSAPSIIPLWFFDEIKGKWTEEGMATKQGNTYVGTVSHFTVWNVDLAMPLVFIEGQILDSNNQTVPGFKVAVKIQNYNNNVFSSYTNQSGQFTGYAPANQPLQLLVFNSCNVLVHTQNINPLINSTNLGTIVINSNSTGNQIVFSGTVSNCSGVLVNNGYVDINLNNITYRATVLNGNYSLALPACIQSNTVVQLNAFDSSTYNLGQSVSLTMNGQTNIITNLTACGQPSFFIGFNAYGPSYNLQPPTYDVYTEPGAYFYKIVGIANTPQNPNVSFYAELRPVSSGMVIQKIRIVQGSYVFFLQDSAMATTSPYPLPGGIFSGSIWAYIKDSATGNLASVVGSNFQVKRIQ